MDELLRQRDPTRADVAAAFLLALSLGFRGRYHGASGESEIERRRMQLFAFLFQRNPGLSDDSQLYPQSYAQTLSGKPQSWLPALRPWLLGIAAVLGLYIIASHIVWGFESSRISRMIDDFREGQRPSTNSPTSKK
jgi:type VI secretion system protein ImpK